MDSNQFFRNKIRNINPNKELIKTINSWIGKTYYKAPRTFELLSFNELSQEEEVKRNFSTIRDDLSYFELTTCEVGHIKFNMIILLYKNDTCSYHSIIY